MRPGSWSLLRQLLGRRDADFAANEEASILRAAAAPVLVDPTFRAVQSSLGTSSDDRLLLGSAVGDPELSVWQPLKEIAGGGHALVLGTSGAGKTRLVLGLARQLLKRFIRHPDRQGLVIVDHKGEFVSLFRQMLSAEIASMGRVPAEAFLDRLVVINPFSTEALVPMQILRSDPGTEPELVAAEATTVIDRLGGAGLGVNQDAFLFHALLLGVDRGLSIVTLLGLLHDPSSLSSAASTSRLRAVRSFFGGERRLSDASLQGVRARLHRLLRLRSARLMLGATESLSFKRLFGEKLLLIDLGSPPFGCEDLAAFWSGILTLKLTRAIFERGEADARRPVTLMVDEWQEGLAAGGDIAEHYGRVLAVARSRAVSLVLVSQSLAGAARVEPTLPEVVATNTSIQFLFRASPADARAMAGMLPVVGRRPAEAPAPWEPRLRSPFLDRSAEREALLAEIPSLPARTFYYWNRHRFARAEHVRASQIDIPTVGGLSEMQRWRLEHGALARSLRDLEGALTSTDAPQVFRRHGLPVPVTETPPPPTTAAPRRDENREVRREAPRSRRPRRRS